MAYIPPRRPPMPSQAQNGDRVLRDVLGNLPTQASDTARQAIAGRGGSFGQAMAAKKRKKPMVP